MTQAGRQVRADQRITLLPDIGHRLSADLPAPRGGFFDQAVERIKTETRLARMRSNWFAPATSASTARYQRGDPFARSARCCRIRP
jgi:hypothetical protein